MSDPQPPAFPRVSESPDSGQTTTQPPAPLFSRPGAAEPAASPPAVEPGPAKPSTLGDQSRWRWAVVGVATLLVVGLIGTFLVLAGPRAGTPSTVARYAPSDSVTYAELRLDLPGDQRALLAGFMSHFPGFADQAAFDQKLDETLESMFSGTDTGLDWQTDIDPWFGGEIGLFSSTINPEPGTPPSMTAALTVNDRAALGQLLEQFTGAPEATHEEYQGTTIWTTTLAPGGDRLSLAATDEVLLIGTRAEDIKTALDARADRTPGLADDQFFLQQLAALHADRLGIVYFDGRAIAGPLGDQLPSDVVPGMPNLDWLTNGSAVRVLGELRAESDHLAITTRAERPADADLPPLPANRSTTLAESVPADGLLYVELRDVGHTIGFALDKLITPTASGSGLPVDLSSLQTLLGTPPQDYFDFLLDVGVSVGFHDGAVDAGMVATVDDNAVASSRVDRLLTVLHTLTQFGGGVTFTEQQHGDATLTVIGLGGPAGELGLGTVAVTVSGGRVLIGTGDFVVNALDRTRADSLAARPEYQAALQVGGTVNAGVVFVDVAAARTAVESFLPAAVRQVYEQEQKPFLAPLSHLVVVNTTEGSLVVSHVFLYVE
jgi:hypothetical protein